MQIKTVSDIDVAGKRVLLRVDYNVPQTDYGKILDDTRIRASLPTIEYLLEHRARLIICSHLGRPRGKVNSKYSLGPMAERLSSILKKPVPMTADCIGPEVQTAVSKLKDGDVMLLENLRFHLEEEANDDKFSSKLASLAEIYVNDAFGVSHRAHASVVGVTKYLPTVAGLLMVKEIEALTDVINNPENPYCAIVGGAKISDKMGVVNSLVQKVDVLLVGGGMAATIFKGEGTKVGASLIEENIIDDVLKMKESATERGVRLVLPVDLVIAHRLEAGTETRTVPVGDIPDGWFIADIGPETAQIFAEEVKRCRTVVWNGPMGVFELPVLARGTRMVAEAMAGTDANTVIGGGSTAEAVADMGLADKMTHVSTGGGASLAFLEGKELPGITVLQDAE